MEKRVEVEGIDASTYAGKAATACRTKVRGMMNGDLLAFVIIDFVNFILLHNKFLSNGIIITEDNKEECYIKVIETGDESMIEDLEQYINLKDKIKVVEGKREEYYAIIDALQAITDKNDRDAVNSIVEKYLRR